MGAKGMLNKINHIIPDLLLKPKFWFCRHLCVQIIILLITISNLFQDSNTIAYDRLWIWLLAYVMLNAITYVNIYLLVPRMLLAGRMKRYILSLSAIILFMVSCNIFFHLYFGNISEFSLELIFAVTYYLSNICLLMAGITALFLFNNGVKNKQRIEELQTSLYHAYIGIGQVCNQLESERLAYDYIVDEARKTGDSKTVEAFEAYDKFAPDFPSNEYLLKVRSPSMNKYGVGIKHKDCSMFELVLDVLYYRGYTFMDKIHYPQGAMFSLKHGFREVIEDNLFETSIGGYLI